MVQAVKNAFAAWLGPAGVKFVFLGLLWGVAVHIGVQQLQSDTVACKQSIKDLRDELHDEHERINRIEFNQAEIVDDLNQEIADSKAHNQGAELWKRRILRLEYFLNVKPDNPAINGDR